ncbi:MAG: DUF433 domain-containing protein [Fimbriimonas sp.]
MIPSQLQSVLVRTPDTLGGAVRFRDTRIHVKILFDYVLKGGGLDEFLLNYPDVRREDAQAVLDWERSRLDESMELELAV